MTITAAHTCIAVDNAQLNTILAALRTYQRAGYGEPANRPLDIHAIACGEDTGREDVSLDDAGIDELCEQINTASDAPSIPATTPHSDLFATAPFASVLEGLRLLAAALAPPSAVSASREQALARALRTLIADVRSIEGYWTEGTDDLIRAAEQALATPAAVSSDGPR